MRAAVFLLAILTLLLVLNPPVHVQSKHVLEYHTDSRWLNWKRQHDKSYSGNLPELERYVTWMSNKALIETHNSFANEFGYTLEMNQFADQVYKCIN